MPGKVVVEAEEILGTHSQSGNTRSAGRDMGLGEEEMEEVTGLRLTELL